MSFEFFDQSWDKELLLMLGINLGLMILLVWFVLLWLMLREFRKAIHPKEANAENLTASPTTVAMCEESVNHALHYSNENRDTLNALIQIQQALEKQVAEIRATSQNPSEHDLASIEALNQKLSKSQQLIRKLRGDLDKSVRGLRQAKAKLLEQNDTVDGLRKQKEEIEKQFEQLEREYIMISESGGFQDVEQGFQKEKEQLLATIENYKQKLANQAPASASGAASDELKQKLLAMQKQLMHVNKEKAFIEQKYLELTQKMENGEQ
ncbi:chromosome partitioning protein ParA [Vibrio vulnificus]|nr:chromosome partitioning protein ParA [Vibrio vulnificus]ELQ2465291.1 chromosome partitioning protein ParA [Vibrio vulnificus]